MGEPSLRFDGKVFYPPGCSLQINPKVRVINSEQERQLFGHLKGQMARLNSFAFSLDSRGRMPPLKIGFAKQGQTSGHLAMMNETTAGRITHVHVLCALLPRLDTDDDRQAVESVRGGASISEIPAEMFEEPLAGSTPLVASFFTCQESLNHLVIHNLIQIAAGAFFDQFGIGSG